MTEPRFPKSPADYPSPAEYGRASGLERVLGMNDGRFPAAPMAKTAGLRLLEATEGRVVFEGLPTFEQYNPMGSVHGGWFGILLDSAMGCAIMTRLPEGLAYTTLEYKVNLLRPAHADTGPLHGIGEALHVGARTATATAKIVDARGKLYATGTTTCLVMALPSE